MDAHRRWWRSVVARLVVLALIAGGIAVRSPEADADPGDEVIPCGYGLFCGPLDQPAPPTPIWEPWDRVVQGADAADDWAGLENEAKAAVAAIHEVPADRRVGDFARDEVRAFMFQRLMSVINRQAAGEPISAEEQLWVDRMESLMRAKRAAEAQEAVDQYATWEADPCGYNVPAGFGFDPYDPPCTPGDLSNPLPPTAEQFTAYGTAVVAEQYLASADAEAAWRDAGTMIAFFGALAAGALISGITAGLIIAIPALASSIALAMGSAIVGYSAAGWLAGATVTVAVGAATTVIMIAVIAAVVTAIAFWQLFEALAIPGKLQTRLEDAQNTPVDLAALGGTDEGRVELYSVFIGQTMPDYPTERAAATTPGEHDADVDPQFRIKGTDTYLPVLDTVDWEGNPQQTYMHDGWFVTSTAGGSYEWASKLKYKNGEGRNAIALIRNGRFLVAVKVDATDDETLIDPVETDELWVLGGTRAGRTVQWAGNRAPALAVHVTNDLLEGSSLTFSATTSDPDGDQVGVTWFLQPEDETFGTDCINVLNGNTGIEECAWPGVTGDTVQRTYVRDGTWFGRAVASDGRGGHTEQWFSFRVANVAPTLLSVDTPTVVDEGEVATITGTFTDAGADRIRLTIDWGDGTVDQQSYPCDGPVQADGTCHPAVFGGAAHPTSWFRTHVYADPLPGGASYTVKVKVDDGISSDETTVFQPVLPLPLELRNVTASGAPEGSASSISGFVYNPDGSAFTLTADPGDGSPPVIVSWPCTAGSSCVFTGTPPDPLFVCRPEGCGGVWFTVEHDYADDAPGALDDTSTLTLIRMGSLRDTETIPVNVGNVAPSVLLNNSSLSPDATTMTVGTEAIVRGQIVEPGTDGGRLVVDWGDGSPNALIGYPCTGFLNCPVFSLPTWGEICPGGGCFPGRYFFTLRHTYPRPGRFVVTLTATDDDEGTGPGATRTLTVLPVANVAPSAAGASVTTNEDVAAPVDLTALVSDDLTVPAGLGVEILSGPGHGSVSGTGLQRTYTPAPGFFGPDSFTYRVTDAGSPSGCGTVGEFCLATTSSAVATISIGVLSVLDAPQLALTGPASVSEGATATYTFTVTDQDPGDQIVAATPDCGAAGSLEAGSLIVNAAGGSFRCRFPDGASASTVAVAVKDTGGLTAADSVAVAVGNVAPSLPSPIVTPTNGAIVLAGRTVTLTSSFTDPGDDLSVVTVRWGDGTETVLPARSPGSFSASHTYARADRFTVTVRVDDGEASDVETITVDVVGRPGPKK
jgi:Bacterial Ig domain/PKD domain